MRAPPESLIPITGQPILAARSMILHIFSAITSPSEPPKTVKSWLNTHTRRPSIVPWPVTTASPHGRFFSISNSDVRWRTYVSSSWKEPGSSSFSIRSRAVYLPLACCFSTAFSEAWSTTALRSSSSCSSRSANVSGAFCRMAADDIGLARLHRQLPGLLGSVGDRDLVTLALGDGHVLAGLDLLGAELDRLDLRAVAAGLDLDALALERHDRRAAGDLQRRGQRR